MQKIESLLREAFEEGFYTAKIHYGGLLELAVDLILEDRLIDCHTAGGKLSTDELYNSRNNYLHALADAQDEYTFRTLNQIKESAGI